MQQCLGHYLSSAVPLLLFLDFSLSVFFKHLETTWIPVPFTTSLPSSFPFHLHYSLSQCINNFKGGTSFLCINSSAPLRIHICTSDLLEQIQLFQTIDTEVVKSFSFYRQAQNATYKRQVSVCTEDMLNTK